MNLNQITWMFDIQLEDSDSTVVLWLTKSACLIFCVMLGKINTRGGWKGVAMFNFLLFPSTTFSGFESMWEILAMNLIWKYFTSKSFGNK